MSNVKTIKTVPADLHATAVSKLNNYEGRGDLRTYMFVCIRDPQAPDGLRTRRVNVVTDRHADHEMAQRRVRELRDANPDIQITGRLTIDYF